MARLVGRRVRATLGATLVAASLGGIALGVAIPAGATTTVTLSAPTAACIANTQACDSQTSKPGRPTTVSSGDVTVKATGRGTVAVGTYRRDPVGVLSSSTGKFVGVALSAGNKFTSVHIKDCNLAGGAALYWWNGKAWVPVLSQGGTTYTSKCITVTIGSSSTPKLAAATKLSRLSSVGSVVFAVAGYPKPT